MFLGNTRGTNYSQKHLKYDPITDAKEFWDFSFAEMGLYDNPANIRAIKAKTNVDKVFYLGYSLGTFQYLYGLAHLEDSFHQYNVHKAVLLAPGFIPSTYDIPQEYVLPSYQYREKNKVYSMAGPNWKKDNKTLCKAYGKALCAAIDWYQYAEPGSVKTENHMSFNAYEDRFQEWAPNYLAGERQTALVPVDTIDKVPISIFAGELDSAIPLTRA